MSVLINASTSGGIGITSDNSGIIQFQSNGANTVQIAASGNVGIGTISPGAKFDTKVTAPNVNIAAFSADLGTNNNRSLVIKSPATDSITEPFRLSTGNSIAFEIDNVERMRVDAAGNIGIGTASPNSLLNLYSATSSQIYVQGDAASRILIERASADASGPSIEIRKARGTIASPTAVQAGDGAVLGAVQVFGGTNYRNIGYIGSFVDTYTSDSNISGHIQFRTNGGSTTVTERFRIGPIGQLGIGGANYGTSGQVLTSGGSGAAPSWQDKAVSATAVATTSGSAVDFTGIPSTAKRIFIMVDRVSLVGTSGTVGIQVGTSADGVLTAGYSQNSQYFNGTTVSSSSSSARFNFMDTFSASDSHTGNAILTNITGNTWVYSAVASVGGAATRTGITSGSIVLTSPLDRIRLMISVAGTFDAGQINIMYE